MIVATLAVSSGAVDDSPKLPGWRWTLVCKFLSTSTHPGARSKGTDLPGVNALAQTTDGYLWLGTKDGLIRFDGIRFTPWHQISRETLSGNIRFLAAPPRGGGLWIGADSGVIWSESGRLRRHPDADAWLEREGKVAGMAQDQSGDLVVYRLVAQTVYRPLVARRVVSLLRRCGRCAWRETDQSGF